MTSNNQHQLLLSYFFLLSTAAACLCFLLVTPLVSADMDEDYLKVINDYRKSHNMQHLNENKQAKCWAETLLNDGKFGCAGNQNLSRDTVTDTLKKCHIDPTKFKTKDGPLLSPNVLSKRQQEMIVKNSSMIDKSTALRDPKYNAIGVGDKGNCVVTVLGVQNKEGKFESRGIKLDYNGLVACFSSLLLGFLIWF